MYDDILQTIGNTPLVRLNRLGRGKILAKIESRNPGSSVKDRIALAMIEDAEKSGKLKPGGSIVEPTSGNTGIGLAMVTAVRGYKAVFTMPESMSIERRKILKAFGAELVLTPKERGMKGAIEKAEELVKEKGYVMLQQFANMANPAVHERTTGPEIEKQLEGQVPEFFVAGVGTGGTISGVGKYLKGLYPRMKVIAAEPDESAVISGEKPGPHKIQGIGAGFIPDTLNKHIIDRIIRVKG
ncbi:MAG: cysteine synthase A, partial [Nanoarchaeota archaeon]|nr:cysteine synthase A [Nanoarchaeota archaeon]